MTSQTFFKINWDYFPIKAHYFFLYGGCGGTVSFMPIVAKEFGIRPMAVGIIFTLIPLCVWISKPAFGYITDKFRNIRNILIILLLVTGLTFFAVLYIPPIRNKEVVEIEVAAACNELRDKLVIHLSKHEKVSSCNTETMKKENGCELLSYNCLKNKKLISIHDIMSSLSDKDTEITISFTLQGKYNLNRNISDEECNCLGQNLSSFVCKPDFYECNSSNTTVLSEYKMYNFWIFVFLAIISGTGSGTMWSLTDAACNEILGDNSHKYGKQRVWGTVSWGLTTLTAGILNNLDSSNSNHKHYSPGFYLMLAFFAIDIIILCSYRIKKTHTSINICKDVGKIFSSMRTIIFAVGVYICGALSGLLWTYQFWLLTELGANSLLLGLVIGIQCLAAEVPFFFFSGWFVKKFGHFYCLIAAVTAFALRMGLYSLLQDDWWVIPIELLHGLTFALFFAAMTSYAVDYAVPGTEATMIGIFGGIFEGLGVATGSFLGGLGYEAKGGHWTFFVASMISLASALVLTILNVFLSRSQATLKLGTDRAVSMKTIANSASQDSIK